MAYYGPKTLNEKGDTVYYSVPDISFVNETICSLLPDSTAKKSILPNGLVCNSHSFLIDTSSYPVYIILFLDSSLRKDGYKLKAFIDYVQYKAKDLKDVPVFFISDYKAAFNNGKVIGKELKGDFDSLKINLPDFHPLLAKGKDANEAYFKGKPYYVFNYFAVLVDKHRHIRGYYDPNQNSEVKRLVQEYKHLKTKDEYANTLKQNDLEQK